MGTFCFAGSPDVKASDVLRVCEAETARQWRELVMIPSESVCHPAAAALLGGELGAIYAEGLPQPLLCHDPRPSASDAARFNAWRSRLSDRRFYKGTVNADRVELIGQRRVAEAFARLPGSPPADDIFVNLQPLSGAAANLSVFVALLKPGDRIMGLDLSHGGHLTHGSRFNFSGKTYEAHSYGADLKTRRLDYGAMERQARDVKPRLIIGGASAYPWDFDWPRMRAIADSVGALLMADVAHLAGLIVGGAASNPLPHAHVVTFTTHKTLCGPRGAVILSADPELAHALDMAVFPGMQGGPHMNSIAAIARLFELILEDPEGFAAFQRKVVDNTRFFSERLAAQGFALEYGGTNTHMTLVDLKPWPVTGEGPLDGETASRLLELSGIVCNKNALPGDPDGAHASGLRFGLTWLTQRGVTREQLGDIADVTRAVLSAARTARVWMPSGEQRCRGRVPWGALDEAARRTLAVAQALPWPPKPAVRPAAVGHAGLDGRSLLLARGDKARLAMSQVLTARPPAQGQAVRAKMLDGKGGLVADVVALALAPQGREERFALAPLREQAATARRWLEALSDGYLLFDERDPQKKMDGPVVIEEAELNDLSKADVEAMRRAAGAQPREDATKPYFIGQTPDSGAPPKPLINPQPAEAPVRQTTLFDTHRGLNAKMAPFAGWEMPIQYPCGISAEHRAVRVAAGLFDVSHMMAIEVSGHHALEFLETALANCASRLDPGECQYSAMLYPDGSAVDDVYVYRLERERFMVVANAGNASRVWAWLEAVNGRRVAIDPADLAKEAPGPVTIRDLRDAGADSRCGLALQGPASLRALQALTHAQAEKDRLARLKMNQWTLARVAGEPALAARTGYTGEKMGFEIYVHPAQAPKVWAAILDAGQASGVTAAGLGARDSARVEAGLPLFGHEIEGELGVSLVEAGYGFVFKLHKPFFIGRQAHMARAAASKRRVIRLQGQGRKSLRAGHVILDGQGGVAGQVTSFAYAHADMTFIVLALVNESFAPQPGEAVKGARVSPAEAASGVEERQRVDLTAMTRFPTEEERFGWVARYR